MNRIAILLILAIGLSGCETISNTVADRVSDNGQQHVAIAVLLAQYYCENKVWPREISEVRSYQEEKGFPLPVEVNWLALDHPEVSFNVTEQVLFKTPEINKEIGDIAVSSIHSFPVCQGGNIEVKVHINLGS
ncbi:hypothetical protein [Microbulbifer sp. JMSA003]|uniref:hypothetical protein n=1 Tax=Microbulbifer sp. JMSA003 TaxID=3243369 RepID=UPI0040397A44